jgi:hypothetical protein
MAEKMHRHCNAVTVSESNPSHHVFDMATDTITVVPTEGDSTSIASIDAETQHLVAKCL